MLVTICWGYEKHNRVRGYLAIRSVESATLLLVCFLLRTVGWLLPCKGNQIPVVSGARSSHFHFLLRVSKVQRATRRFWFHKVILHEWYREKFINFRKRSPKNSIKGHSPFPPVRSKDVVRAYSILRAYVITRKWTLSLKGVGEASVSIPSLATLTSLRVQNILRVPIGNSDTEPAKRFKIIPLFLP